MSTPVTDPRARDAADLFRQAADPTRLQVLALLSGREMNVTELCGELAGVSQPALSHHLALLRVGRLIHPRRQGKHNDYGLTGAGRSLAGVAAALAAGEEGAAR